LSDTDTQTDASARSETVIENPKATDDASARVRENAAVPRRGRV